MNNPITSIFSTSNSTSNSNDTSSSRLSTNSAKIREVLLSRNLYTEFDDYPLDENKRQRIVNSISGILSSVMPFSSINLKNSVLGRLVSTPTTPLSEIGLVMLSKQFARNFSSNAIQNNVPVLNVNNLWDGDPNTKLFTKRIDYSITKKEEGGNLDEFLKDYVGFYPERNNPFNRENVDNNFILKNTGNGQLNNLFKNLNYNVYKPSGDVWVDVAQESNNKFKNDDSEYTSDLEFGETKKETNKDFEGAIINPWISAEDGFNENIENQIVWGRDGITPETNSRLKSLRGVDSINPKSFSEFNVKGGILEYTKNLMNANKGRVVDQTRKVYLDDKKKLKGLNGSGVWEAPSTALPAFANKKGIRQHSILDQYNRFAKAIRFNGNKVYQGNENSTIYSSVLPKIHPILDENGKINNKNMMFSLENLAVNIIGGAGDDDYGILDDEFGTLIPKSEVGHFGGRIMWFAPYGIELNESSSAKFDSTVMVGRNEPIYSYMHSERSATLSFTLIIDYPKQVKNFLKTGKHKDLAEFFSFGGNDYTPSPQILNTIKNQVENERTKENIEGKKEKVIPEVQKPEVQTIAFPNDVPKVQFTPTGELEVVDNLSTIVDELYTKYSYEVIKGLIRSNSYEGNKKSHGLNDKIFIDEGLSEVSNGVYRVNVPSSFSQSNADYKENTREIDTGIYNVFKNSENSKYYKIIINGKATALYTPGINSKADLERTKKYNKFLSEKRAEAAKIFIENRIKKILGKTADQLGIIIETTGLGIVSENNDTKESIPTLNAKLERVAEISFLQYATPPEEKVINLPADEQENINTLVNENQGLEKTENKQKKVNTDSLYNERTSNSEANLDTGILNGFQSITKNYFYPAFHSQTPDDFHKRLTFLQQCLRQGSAIRSNVDSDENGIIRAKNSVFGRQPFCILRIGDFFHTKIVPENLTIDYTDSTWDLNPEGKGMQPMIAKVTLQMKVIGGQSLKGPIDALQNAVTFNYYANSTFDQDDDIGKNTTKVESMQEAYNSGIDSNSNEKNNDN